MNTALRVLEGLAVAAWAFYMGACVFCLHAALSRPLSWAGLLGGAVGVYGLAYGLWDHPWRKSRPPTRSGPTD